MVRNSGVIDHRVGEDGDGTVHLCIAVLYASRVDSARELLLPPRVLQQSHDSQANPGEAEQTHSTDSVQSLPHVGSRKGR